MERNSRSGRQGKGSLQELMGSGFNASSKSLLSRNWRKPWVPLVRRAATTSG